MVFLRTANGFPRPARHRGPARRRPRRDHLRADRRARPSPPANAFLLKAELGKGEGRGTSIERPPIALFGPARWSVVASPPSSRAIGACQLARLPIDAVPDITNNQVQINTTAPALSPAEVEKQVTFPIETALAGIPGLESTRSLSRNGFCAGHRGLHGEAPTSISPASRSASG